MELDGLVKLLANVETLISDVYTPSERGLDSVFRRILVSWLGVRRAGCPAAALFLFGALRRLLVRILSLWLRERAVWNSIFENCGTFSET